MTRSEVTKTKHKNRKTYLRFEVTEYLLVLLVVLPVILYHFQNAL